MGKSKKIDILLEVKSSISQLFKKQNSNKLVYHTFNHILNLLEIGEKITAYYKLEEEDQKAILLAICLQHIGYLTDYQNAHQESIAVSQRILDDLQCPSTLHTKVLSLIDSIYQESKSKSLLEEILHDIYIIDIGQKEFDKQGMLLRIEREIYLNESLSNEEWERNELDFLLNNDFYTQFAIENYGKRRTKNINKQYLRLKDSKQKNKKKKSGKSFGRGIETLYRATYRNHINLSSIADAKANMMISINTIIMSVIITFAGAGFTVSSEIIVERLRFTIPIIILLLASLISVVFAVLSARPKVTEKSITEEKLKERKSSILFFGNFTQLPMEKFIEFLNGFKRNQKLLYDNMTIDIYFLGLVLNQKYKLLRISYNVFMVGLVLSVITFIGILFYTNM